MDWYSADTRRCTLTMLVVDLRNSSTFFQDSPPEQVARFVRELSGIVHNIVQDVTDGEATEAHVDKFTGDGFLVLFDEPAPESLVKVGPARALVAARRIRQGLSQLLRIWPELFTARSDLSRLGLVGGIVVGEVLFGPLTAPATRAPTVLLEPVVKAFRFAQVRDDPAAAHPDAIFICGATRSEVVGLRDSPEIDTHEKLAMHVTDADFHAVRPRGLKGVRDPSGFQVVWQGEASPPPRRVRVGRELRAFWRRVRER